MCECLASEVGYVRVSFFRDAVLAVPWSASRSVIVKRVVDAPMLEILKEPSSSMSCRELDCCTPENALWNTFECWLVDYDARARHVKKKFEQAQRQGKHRVACTLADELGEWLSERGTF